MEKRTRHGAFLIPEKDRVTRRRSSGVRGRKFEESEAPGRTRPYTPADAGNPTDNACEKN